MHRHSKKRELIYNCISSTDTHPTAEWIYSKLKPEIPDLSLATVYRNIAYFKANNMVKSVAVVNGQERIDACVSQHSHFICEKCNGIFDVKVSQKDDLADTPSYKKELRAGFKINTVNVTYFGLCDECNQ